MPVDCCYIDSAALYAGAGYVWRTIAISDLIKIDSKAEVTPFNRFFSECIGSCHAYLTLREDFRDHVRRVQRDIGFKRIRCHGIFHDLVGVVHSSTSGVAGGSQTDAENESASSIYNFSNVDAIYDFFLSEGLQPYVELSFMPESLASSDDHIFRYQANISPPAKLAEWTALIRAFVSHLIDRYGIDEVRQWYFEVWNEPDLKDVFWTGSQQDYFELYLHTVETIKDIDSQLLVGGPSTSKNLWIKDFLDYCASVNAPVDFVSTHHYCADASLEVGSPIFDIAWRGQAAMRRDAAGVRAKIQESQFPAVELHYTEWNVSPCHEDSYGKDSEFNAVFILQTLKDMAGVSNVYSYWTISDIFEESGPGLYPFSGKYGLLNRYGIPKPSFHAYRFLSEMHDLTLPCAENAWLTCSKDGQFRALFWNYREPTVPDFDGGDYDVDHQPLSQTMVLEGIHGRFRIHALKVGRADGNSYRSWQAMGSPQYPDNEQIDRMLQDSQPKVVLDQLESLEGELRLHHTLESCEFIYYDITVAP